MLMIPKNAIVTAFAKADHRVKIYTAAGVFTGTVADYDEPSFATAKLNDAKSNWPEHANELNNPSIFGNVLILKDATLREFGVDTETRITESLALFTDQIIAITDESV